MLIFISKQNLLAKVCGQHVWWNKTRLRCRLAPANPIRYNHYYRSKL